MRRAWEAVDFHNHGIIQQEIEKACNAVKSIYRNNRGLHPVYGICPKRMPSFFSSAKEPATAERKS